MKKVTKKNILKYIKMKQEYGKNQDSILLTEINSFTENVINADKHYYKKLYTYELSNEQLKYCL